MNLVGLVRVSGHIRQQNARALPAQAVQSDISDFGFEMQESSNFKFVQFNLLTQNSSRICAWNVRVPVFVEMFPNVTLLLIFRSAPPGITVPPADKALDGCG